jgi:NAD(P)-dependent dehydrogenase (short-subunit alcohol dehydrogenase family)
MYTSVRPGTQPEIAVFGAAGHTGHFVVQELLRRGIAPIAIARNVASLASKYFPGHEEPTQQVLRRQAYVGDNESLDRALDGATAVINCAGPFLETADAVANAALRARIHYLDVTAEQASARSMLESYDVPARQAGIALIPSMSFYGGFADLLATTVLGDWDHADAIDIMIGLDSWHPTRGTRITGERNTGQRLVVAGGWFVPVSSPRSEKDWEFVDPLGSQAMVEVPFSEIVLIARHLKIANLHTWLSRNALEDIHNSETPAPKPADESGRSSQRFIVDVVATRDGGARRIIARGRDIYAFSATLVCEAAERLLKGSFSGPGAQPPGAILNSQEVLSALTPDHITFEVSAM